MKSQRIAIAASAALLFAALSVSAQQSAATHWIGIWSTADTWRAPAVGGPPGAPPLVPSLTPAAVSAPVATPVATQPAAGRGAPPAPVQFNGQTLRQVVHTTFGGDRMRVGLGQAFRTQTLTG